MELVLKERKPACRIGTGQVRVLVRVEINQSESESGSVRARFGAGPPRLNKLIILVIESVRYPEEPGLDKPEEPAPFSSFSFSSSDMSLSPSDPSGSSAEL